MSKPVLYVTRRLPPSIEARAKREYDARLSPDDAVVTPEQILRGAQGADAVLCSPAEKLSAETIAALPDSVRVIGTFSVGFDHIDIAAARARRIPVVNTPDVLSVSTAECALLLILMAARRAGEGERLVRSGKWAGWAPTQLMGQGVVGRRIGIFGMGRIGRELAKLARGLAMEVHYRDVSRLPVELEEGATYHTTDESFLPACEILSLNAPGGEGTRHWLNAKRIALLPRGAVVANAARGTLIDDEALIAALRSGHVAAAGLDVYNNEPNLNPAYMELESVVLLPHLGSATMGTRDRMGNLVLDGIGAALAGRTPANLVQ
ncbi:MAG TPA: D-glycerate dehydrogenase [Acidisphaera sp.]|nr:D-glycerate dehydrogenase [Acidisphaera sp.]